MSGGASPARADRRKIPGPGRSQGSGQGRGWKQPALIVLLILSILPEAALQAADLGLWSGAPARLRQLVYQYGAFWPGLLGDWKPNYPGQPALMFLTYGFLHAGLWHLVLNMMTLVSLGQLLIERLGQRRFLLLYTLSILGGAVGYALMSTGITPMVGASGALFGLAAGVIVVSITERIDSREPGRLVVRALTLSVLGLIALNVLMYYVMGGQLAWETHLGGFLGGWLAISVLDRSISPGEEAGNRGESG
ncbi:rhomboid family intramembrane serine protease [Pseudooceanicola nitratireducens]|uniref:rhomboid family intramembrane serine protease n=1 Tax=Pseudooceanicola nitratireducens TaxID=517719 RepID=UPI0035177BF4